MPEKEKPSYPTCPSCGSSDFSTDGYVSYVAPFDAKTGQYGISKMMWDDDITTGVRCASCDKDVTALFKKFNVFPLFRISVKKK
jgi:hypothetical protein